MSYIVILGANSDIAKALAHRYAKEGFHVVLAARNREETQKTATDIAIRYGVHTQSLFFDACDLESFRALWSSLSPRPNGVIVAFGTLEEPHDDASALQKLIDINFTAPAQILEIVACEFEERRHGFIVGISSVAGDRGRASNYLYGSAKAGFSAYLSGLRNRLHKANVSVLTVKPGFVETKMTQGMNLPQKLVATPQQVADDIFKAQQKNSDVLYTRWFWRYIMLIIKHIPEGIFKKLSL